MEGRMKGLGKYKAVIALLCFTATIFSGCGKKTDAVITDVGDVTVVSAEHETVEESSADIFTYKDLKIGNVSYLMTESQVMAILGKPTEETETNGKKIYSYNEMSIGFQKLNNNNKPDWNGTYKVVQAASIGNNDVFSRDLRVGDQSGRSADRQAYILHVSVRLFFIAYRKNPRGAWEDNISGQHQVDFRHRHPSFEK